MLTLPPTGFTFARKDPREKISLRDTLSFPEKLARQTAEQLARSVEDFVHERSDLLKQWRDRQR